MSGTLASVSLRRPPAWANMGGPMSRRRSIPICATLLGLADGPIRCPRVEALALSFGGREPVPTIYELLRGMGFREPEELRLSFGPGLSPKACRIVPELAPLEVGTANGFDVLRQAFLLGLCTAVAFDPARPLLWTEASLTRRLELYDLGGFYA